MPKIRMVAPGVDKDGKILGVGGEYDVDDETAHDLRMDGKALYVDDEKAQIKAAQEGNYTARTGRAGTTGDTAAPSSSKDLPGPSAPSKEKEKEK